MREQSRIAHRLAAGFATPVSRLIGLSESGECMIDLVQALDIALQPFNVGVNLRIGRFGIGGLGKLGLFAPVDVETAPYQLFKFGLLLLQQLPKIG
jgi:hypothetical protein